MRLSGEKRETISDLVSILVDVQSDPSRRSGWYLNFPKFMKQEECRVSITNKDRFFFSERAEHKLGRMMEAIGRLPEGALLKMLLNLARVLDSENGSLWYWELRRFLSGKVCWSSPLTEDQRAKRVAETRTYLRVHFILRGDGYDLIAYERIRTASLRQTFESVGRLDKICLQSLQAVQSQAHLFGGKLRSIKDNDTVLFLYRGERVSEKYVAAVDLSWSGNFEIVSHPFLEVADTILELTEGNRKSKRRIIVVLDLP